MSSKKTNQEIAQEVIAGLWDSGLARRQKLEAAGYDYGKVQSIVNAIMSNQPVSKEEKKQTAPTTKSAGNESRLLRVEIDLQKYVGLELIIKP